VIQQFREESDHLRHELSHPAQQAEKFRKWLRHPDVRLVLSLVGGTAVWGLYFSSLHALNSLACRFGWFGVPAESGGLKLIQVAVTVLALALITAAGYNAYNLWRTTRRSASDDASVPGHPIEPGNLEQTVAAYTPFAAFVLLLLNAIYFLIILVSLAPIATLTPCGG
jgi:hypothetical protein